MVRQNAGVMGRGRMLRKVALGLATGVALAAAPMIAPASAQMAVGDIPPYEMNAIARSAGLRPIGPAMRQGPHYVLRAVDRRGEERRVVIDARYGEVISAVPVVRMPD